MKCLLLILVFLVTIFPLSTEPAYSQSLNHKPNLLLITLDTTREDSLGTYGHMSAETPVMDRLAREGALFQNAWCSAPLTLPSHITIMTGLHPPSHGIPVNGAGSLSVKIPVLAELVKTSGYRTGAFISSAVLSRYFGLDRGFNFYNDVWSLTGVDGTDNSSRPADRVCDTAINWLGEDPHSPFMAWIHLYDPHTPYSPPRQYTGAGLSNYDGEIAFVDRQIQRVISWLAKNNRLKNTLVVIVGDHGEAFQEHQETQHGLFIYDTTMKVPFLLWNTYILPPEVRNHIYSSPVRLVDLMPTILDLMGLSAPEIQDGQNLIPLMKKKPEWTLPCYAESRYPHLAYGWAPLESVVLGEWKYIEAPRPELYNLKDDPGETINLIKTNPDMGNRLREEIKTLISMMNITEADPLTLDADMMQQLESLGYVAGISQVDDNVDTKNLRDPKDMHEVFTRQIEVRNLIRNNQLNEAIPELESLLKLSPESGDLHYELGKAYFDTGQYEKAIPELRAGLTRAAKNPLKMTILGDALRKIDRTDEAVQVYEDLLKHFPRYGQAHSRLGVIFTDRDDFTRAHHHMKTYTKLYPNSPNAFSNFGNSMMKFGQFEEAASALQRAVDLQPDLKSAHRNLWMAYLKIQRRQEAIQSLEAAVIYLPENLIIANRLAWFLAVSSDQSFRDPDRAISIALSCLKKEPARPLHLDTLAAAYAAAGDFTRAERYAGEAAELAAGSLRYQQQINRRLNLYQAGKPYIE